MMSSLGHTIVPPVPSLFSFKIKDANLTDLSGSSTDLCEMKLIIPKAVSKVHKALLRPSVLSTLSQRGPLLVTHQGKCEYSLLCYRTTLSFERKYMVVYSVLIVLYWLLLSAVLCLTACYYL